MIGKYSLSDGKILIKLAREAIKSEYDKKKVDVPVDAKFKQARGVFVTLNSYPKKELRGCIGLPYPSMSVRDAVVHAAKSAAFDDSRFSVLKREELDKVVIEISILTQPEDTNSKNIKVGVDGLIGEYHGYSGLLLPQVATENSFDKIEFLECLCHKCGVQGDAWQNPNFDLKKFQCQIFSEKTPKGDVEER
ncbi:MAG: TIGR00296 family protein [Nanoarchaeota archaeon]|nr:TIGR00296 family protein [Nanoarchaeota archaeon]